MKNKKIFFLLFLFFCFFSFFTQAGSEKPEKDLSIFHEATELIQQGRLEEARPLLLNLNEKYPEDSEFLFLKSGFLARKEDYKGAIDALTRILEKQTRQGKAYLQRGFLYLIAFSYDLALDDFKKAAKYLDKKETAFRQIAFLEAGLILLKINFNQDQAKKYINKGVALDPDSAIVKEFYEKIEKW